MADTKGDLGGYVEALGQGPRKKRVRGRPKKVYATHKFRSRWFQAREAWPFREVRGSLLEAERRRVAAELEPSPGEAQWEFAGPSNIGGRMTSLVCDPGNPDRIVAGAAGGGLWRSEDAGRNWQSLWHKEPSLNIGALAIDPSNPDIVYCGTGEANMSADSHPGVGLYVTRDFGDSWELLSDSDVTGIPMRIGTIAIDPFDSAHIRLGGLSHGVGSDGMFTSRDGGRTWTRESFATSGLYRCHDIRFDTGNAGTLYTVITARGSLSGIWRSTDGGSSWTHLTHGFPHPSELGRGAIVMAPSDSRRLYAQFSNKAGGVLGVFKSENGGDTWTTISGSHFASERQMFYNNAIVVHPTDPDLVICGGVDLHRTRNGGRTWRRVTDWWRDREDAKYAHADQHALLMPAADPGRVYACNDGGMDVSENGGNTWQNRSDDLAVTMYYDLEIAQSDSRMYGGGCQDNGTNITVTGSTDDHFMISGGDGGWITIDPTNPLHFFTSSQGMRILRFRQPEGWTDVSPLPERNAERRSMWMVFIAMDQGDPQRVFTGTQRVFRTLNDGDDWEAVSGVLDGSDITAIDVALGDSRCVYVGTENGGIFRSLDGGDSWSGDVSGPLLPGRTITRLKSSPADARLVYATVASMDGAHVFRSSDAGESWEDIDRGRLPHVPHHGIAVPPRNPDHVYVCGDVGVYASTDRGETWRDITRNLPNAMVVDLVYHRIDNTLTAATYGRSLWRLQLA